MDKNIEINTHKHCILCNSSKLKNLVKYYEKHALIKCKACGFVFMEKKPTKEELEAHYRAYCYISKASLSPITIQSYKALLDEFEKYRKTNKILDVGCGRGWFLQEAKKRGWEVYGIEYSETAVNICEANGIKIKSGKLKSNLFDLNSFDVISSFEVIEHINYPNQELQSIYSLLRQGGLFYCTTPNFNSLLRYYLKADYSIIGYPEHLSYYTRRTLNKVVRRNGFKKIKFLSTGISITRFKNAQSNTDVKCEDSISEDEKLRQRINKKWYLKIAKTLTNKFLTLTSLGMTLKGYYIKENNNETKR